jgi:ATP-dependent Clp protease ATP-binding subunit ClpA
MGSLKDYFRPEFLNRIDDIILFDILSKESIQNIVKIQVKEVVDRLAAKDIYLEISQEVYEYLAREGYNPQYGARPLRRLIQNKILTQVANLMISRGITKGGTILVGIKGEAFTFDVKKVRKGVKELVV